MKSHRGKSQPFNIYNSHDGHGQLEARLSTCPINLFFGRLPQGWAVWIRPGLENRLYAASVKAGPYEC